MKSPSIKKNLSNDVIRDRWLDGYATPSTYTYRYAYDFLMDVLGNQSLLDLTSKDILRVQAELNTRLQTAETKNLQRTLRSKGVGIRSLLKFLFKEHLISENLAGLIDLKHPKLLELPRSAQARSIQYRLVEVNSLSKLSPEDKMLFWLVIFVRLPIDEVLSITWSNFDPVHQTLNLVGQDDEVTQVTLDPKIWDYLISLRKPTSYAFDPVFDHQGKLTARRSIDQILHHLGFSGGMKAVLHPHQPIILSPLFSLLS